MANELGLRNVSFEVNDLQAAVDWAASDPHIGTTVCRTPPHVRHTLWRAVGGQKRARDLGGRASSRSRMRALHKPAGCPDSQS
jgi:hypothetical protein